MRLRTQNLTDGQLPLWREGRGWWGRFSAEWYVFRRPQFSLGFRKGGHVSDGSGIQVNASLLLFTLYLTFDTANLFGRSYRPLKQRNLTICWYDGTIQLELWTADDDYDSKRPWHRNTVFLHVKDWILGKPRYSNVEGEPIEVLIPMPEGCYLAVAKSYRSEWRRRFGLKKVSEGWDFRIDGGIPFEGKGENSWDCDEDGLWGIMPEGTLEEAIGKVVTSVLKSRSRRNGKHLHRDLGFQISKPCLEKMKSRGFITA